MGTIEIKRFNDDNLEDLAEKQTKIYNKANSSNPNFVPTKVEDVIARFKRETFDQSRMFYAYEGDKMVGYAGLTGKDKDLNLRGMGFPWLTEGVDNSIRDQLYEAMVNQCKDEGTKILRVFASPQNQERLDFFENKKFQVKIEFLIHNKALEKNDFEIPGNYQFRELSKEDLPHLVEVSKQDPKLKNPFVLANWENFMDSSGFDSSNVVVAESENKLVGLFAMFIPNDPKGEKAFFGGVAVHGEHEKIEPFLLKEVENRALTKGKNIMETTFYPDSMRLPYAKENGYKEIRKSYQLEKEL